MMGDDRPIARSALLPIAFLLLISTISHFVSATCFFPDGSEADSGHKECNPNTSDATTCCAEDFQCLSNGLCNDYRYQNWTRVLRGACTHADFGGGCTEVCKDYWPQGDEAVWYCGSGAYCCSRANDCCQDSQVEKHNLGEPSVVAIAGKTTPTASTASTSSPSITPTQTAAQAPGRGSTNTRTIAIAVGVVAGLLLVLLVGGVWYLIRRRRTRQNRPVTHELSAAGGPSNKHGGVQPSAYDDKRGGWVLGANEHENKRRNEVAAQGGGRLHELQADKAVEMSAQAEAREMDAMGPKFGDGRGFQHFDADEIERRSLTGSRRSRFVEVDMGTAATQRAQRSREQLDRYG